jgi:hypothetical protein
LDEREVKNAVNNGHYALSLTPRAEYTILSYQSCATFMWCPQVI